MIDENSLTDSIETHTDLKVQEILDYSYERAESDAFIVIKTKDNRFVVVHDCVESIGITGNYWDFITYEEAKKQYVECVLEELEGQHNIYDIQDNEEKMEEINDLREYYRSLKIEKLDR